MPTSSASSISREHAALVSRLERLERRRRAADAEQLRVIGDLVAAATAPRPRAPDTKRRRTRAMSFDPTEFAYRSLRAEIALVLGMSEHRAERLMDLAYRTTTSYPEVMRCLKAGEVNIQHAQVISDEGMLIPIGDDPVLVERRAAYEQATLEAALVETPNRLRPIARSLAEKWSDSPIETRHERARTARRVTVCDAGEGMADLYAHLPAVEAYAIHDRLTRIAKASKQRVNDAPEAPHSAASHGGGQVRGRGTEVAAQADAGSPSDGNSPSNGADPDEGASPSDALVMRSLDNLRADALTDLLLSADPFALKAGCSAEAVHASIQLIAPAEIVAPIASTQDDGGAGNTSLPGELAGYGPVDAGEIRKFITSSTRFRRVRTNFSTGEVLSVESYRPNEEIRRRITARDRRCRFPGCRVPVQRCDLDHTKDAALGGPTSTDNLAALCRGHHTLKHHSEWSVRQDSNGILEWRSPSGRTHLDHPPGLLSQPQRRRLPDETDWKEKRLLPPRTNRVRFEPPEPPEMPF